MVEDLGEEQGHKQDNGRRADVPPEDGQGQAGLGNGDLGPMVDLMDLVRAQLPQEQQSEQTTKDKEQGEAQVPKDQELDLGGAEVLRRIVELGMFVKTLGCRCRKGRNRKRREKTTKQTMCWCWL